jgi:hypothetical protein
MRGQVNTTARADSTIDLYLELVPEVPTLVWGRDELRAGEMWSSNSVVSWLLARGPQQRHDRTADRRTCTRLEGRLGCCETTAAQADIARNPRISGVLSALRVSRTLGA